MESINLVGGDFGLRDHALLDVGVGSSGDDDGCHDGGRDAGDGCEMVLIAGPHREALGRAPEWVNRRQGEGGARPGNVTSATMRKAHLLEAKEWFDEGLIDADEYRRAKSRIMESLCVC